MKKPNMMAMSTIVILAGSSLILPSILQFASAQYSAAPEPGSSSSIEEQLQLAKEKISNARQAGAYGSGTPMLGTNISETVIFVGILVAIFGAVAAMFFYRSRTAKKAAA